MNIFSWGIPNNHSQVSEELHKQSNKFLIKIKDIRFLCPFTPNITKYQFPAQSYRKRLFNLSGEMFLK